MEQIKRSRDNNIHEYDDSKRKKISLTTEEAATTFEDLSNEVIYEIFEFLDFHHAFQGFYDLNKRFQNLFVHSNLPIKINISSIPKSIFHRYLTDIIIPHPSRIQSLRLSSPFAVDIGLLLSPLITNLTRLETLIINDIKAVHIVKLVNQLFSLPFLSSLFIKSIGSIRNQNNIYQKIFRLPALKYCKLFIRTVRRLESLSIATNEFSPIEHLVINNQVSINQLDSLLSYVPQLRRLSFDNFNGYISSRIRTNAIQLNYLTDVSLKSHSISFNDFESLVIDLFRQVQILHIEIYSYYFSAANTGFLNADRWKQLISTHMINLRIFDLQLEYGLCNDNINRQAYETEVSKFNSLFWIEHQWFFEYQYYKNRNSNTTIFYSTNPYRRKKYMLCGEPDSNTLQTNVDSVHHVCIHQSNTIKQFGGHVTNANELTLSETFDVPRDSIVNNLNHTIPLRQLTKLTLACHRLPFKQVIELLHLTPNIHTLKLDSILLYRTDSLSIQKNDLFQIVSNTNTLTTLTINKEVTFEKVQLLVTLFPRLEYLTINLYKKDLESIARFLLSKSNNNTHYLSSWCISKKRPDLIKNLRLLLESEKLLNDYILKSINRKLYLWW